MAVGVDGRWVAGIGDPSMVGWVTVAAYTAATLLAARNLFAARRGGRTSSFWAALTVLLLALGLNKQLDLQSWFGQTGRDLALAQGWYGVRRIVQGAFIAALAVGAVATLLFARRAWAGHWREYRLVFGGLVLLVIFIVIRAASFHHADELIGIDLGATTLGRAFELLGIVAIALACAQWHVAHGAPAAQRARR